VAPEVEEPPKVVDLMEALRRSLDAVSADKKKPAKAKLVEAEPAAAAPKSKVKSPKSKAPVRKVG
jgi:non-homologous end joining protein Ku